MSNRYAIILAGGSGTRFWPLSRKDKPKQFLSINNDRSFIQLTFDRVKQIVPESNIYVVTAQEQAQMVAEHLPELTDKQIVKEPSARNTCPAISLGMAAIREANSDATVIVIPSDQTIIDEKTFSTKASFAMQNAEQSGSIVVFGINPDVPHTGYGYIKAVSEDEISEVDAFVEKPDLKTAENYLKQGGYYWNSGMFVFTVSRFFKELETNNPAIYKGINEITSQESLDSIYPELERVSIDYAIMEKATDIKVVPMSVGWNDVGSWSSVYDVMPKDIDKNNFKNRDSVSIESQGCLGFSNKPIAFVDCNDLVVVETADAILVCPRSSAQKVGKIIDKYKGLGKNYLI